jgi:hypothetical protein
MPWARIGELVGHDDGRTRVIRETRPLSVNEAIGDVEAGRVAARIVFTP